MTIAARKGRGAPRGAEDGGEEGTPWGFYAIDDSDWVLLSPSRGNAMVIDVPEMATGSPATKAVFAVEEVDFLADGSMSVQVKPLDCDVPEALGGLREVFETNKAPLHLCSGIGECTHKEGFPFHATNLELRSGLDCQVPFLGEEGREYLKSLNGKGGKPPKRPPRKEAKATPKASAAKDAKDGEGKKPGGRRKANAEDSKEKDKKKDATERGGQREKDLREKLEDIRKKQERKGARREEDDGPEETDGGSEYTQSSSVQELGLRNGTALPVEDLRTARGQGEPREGILRGSNVRREEKSVGKQLALVAAGRVGKYRRPRKDPDSSSDGGDRKKPRRWERKGDKDRKKKKKKKDRRKKKKKKGGGGGPSSSPSSSSGRGGRRGHRSSEDESDSSESAYLPPLKRKSEKRPGSVLQLLLQQIEEHLDAIGEETSSTRLLGGTKVLAYYNALLRTGVQPLSRDGREMYLLSMVIDLLRVGQLERVGDALAARFLALHQAHLDNGWDAARNLEIFAPEMLSAAGSQLTLRARKHSRMLERVSGKGNPRYGNTGGRGGAGNWPRGQQENWWQGDKGDGKGKGKKGKEKGKQGPWGKNQWRGQNNNQQAGQGKGEEKGEDAQGKK